MSKPPTTVLATGSAVWLLANVGSPPATFATVYSTVGLAAYENTLRKHDER